MIPPVLLVAHGSRVPEAAAQAEQLRAALAGKLDAPVRLGHLELQEPLAIDVLRAMLDEGIEEVVVQPLLLLPGNHATFDVQVVAQVALDAGGRVRIGKALGSHAALLRLAEERVRRAGPADALLVIASGTASDRALRSLDASAALVAAGTSIATVAAAPATLDGQAAGDALAELADDGHRAVTVLPWMLFPGRLEAATTDELRRRGDELGVQLVVAERFGPAPEVLEAVLARIERANAFEGQSSSPSGA